MYLDEPPISGGGHFGPTCLACKNLILEGQHAKRIDFASDPDGARGLSGDYHTACSKPGHRLALARAINVMSRFGR